MTVQHISRYKPFGVFIVVDVCLSWQQVGAGRDPEVIGELYNLHHGATFGSTAQTWAEESMGI